MVDRLDKTITWVFDLDGTFYSGLAQFWILLVAEMRRHCEETLKLPCTWSLEEQKRLEKKWRTTQTVIAYAREFNLDFDAFVKATQIPVLNQLTLHRRKGLQSIAHLPGKKFVLTNAPESVAYRTLEKLNLEDIFDQVYGISNDVQIAKPERAAYERIQASGRRICMVDDWHENLVIPDELGWKTVWFPEPGTPIYHIPHVHHLISSLDELHELYD